MKRLFILFAILCNTLYAGERSWSEGACVEGEKRFEGATRRFYNRGAGQPWENLLGDWLDSYFTPQGRVPFVKFTVPASQQFETIEIDVTSLVKLWQEGVISNQGFRLNNPKNQPLSLVAKEQKNTSYHPMLKLKTSTTHIEVPVEADTILNKSTYRCLGSDPILNARYPVLTKFDISSMNEPIIKATLRFTLATKVSSPIELEIFATKVNDDSDIRMQGLSSAFIANEDLNSLPNIIFFTSFEDDDWSDKWQDTYRGEHQITEFNPKEKFVFLTNID